MLKIAICDDEIMIASQIENMLEKISNTIVRKVEIDVFYDGSTLVNHIKEGMRYDLIYLDIEMKKQNGVDAARELRIIDNKVLIIYVTGHEGFAKEVFEVSAFRFITKPIDIDLFEKYFKDAITQVSRAPQYFQYQYNKISYRLSIDEIMYFQSDRRITYIITKSGSEKCYGKLNK